MVFAKTSSNMNLLQDSEGNINIHEIKASTSGTRIVSNNIFNNHFSSFAYEQNTLHNKNVDITKESQNEKDAYLSMNEDELSKMIIDMVEQENTLQNLPTLQNLSPEGLVQQSIIQEQAQLLGSYNNIIDLPKDIQREISIKPIQEKEAMDVENNQQIHKSHLPSWISKEYTKLIRPRQSKDSHMVTIKKKEHSNVSNHTNVTPILSHEVIKKDILPENDKYHEANSKSHKNNKTDEENHMDTIKKKEHSNVSNHTNVTQILSHEVIKKDILPKNYNYHEVNSKSHDNNKTDEENHIDTIKKKEHSNVSNHTNVTPILSHEVIKKDILPENDKYHERNRKSHKKNIIDEESQMVTIKKKKHLKVFNHTNVSSDNDSYHKNIINSCKKANIDEENMYLVDKTEETKELKQKNEVTITRIRGEHNNLNKKLKRDLKDEHLENVIPHVSTSSIGALNLKGDKDLKSNISFLTGQPSKKDKESVKLENLTEVTMNNCNENIVLHPPIPIVSTGELPLTKPSTSTDNKTREMMMIQGLQTMVPPNIYPQQSLKTFENGNVLLVAPLSANTSNHHRRFIKPKAFVSNINSDPSGSGEKVVTEDSVAAYKHYTSLHGSMPMLDEINEHNDDVRNKFSNKRKLLDDPLLYDMRIGLEGIEMKGELHYEDSITSEEKKKRCRNGIRKEKKWQLEEELSDAEEEKKRQNAKKAKEHREKKKDEIHALKNENMQWQLKCRELEAENKQLKSQVEMLKSIFPMLNVNSIPET